MATYEDVIQAAIKKERSIIGDPAVQIAKDHGGVEVDDEGNVTSLDGDGQEIFADLLEQYIDVGGQVTNSLIANEIKGMDIDDLELPQSIMERL